MGIYTPAKKILKICALCNIETFMDPRAKMCSDECRKKYQQNTVIEKSKERWKDDPDILTCQICRI